MAALKRGLRSTALISPKERLFHRCPNKFFSSAVDHGTFANQARLPRLPVPSLEETASRYLKSCLPLLTSQEYEKTRSIVEAFTQKGGLGEQLQQRLIDYDKTQQASDPYYYMYI
jgi:hypothetical protein